MRKENRSRLSGPKKGLLAALAVFAMFALGAGWYAYSTISAIPEMFKLNEQRKAEGYYMADFEFKMLGCAYYLDKGEYLTALDRINTIHSQLQTTQGLIKLPEFRTKDEELDFYLNLQNPRTGAFMNDSYPLFTYIGPTENVISHIESLCQATGRPLQLKYPLRFLDDISSPESLRAYLDDLATVGWLGAKFRPCYVEATELNGYAEFTQRTGLYHLDSQWQQALLEWFYENQDPETGYWGPRLKSTGKLLDGGDLVSTEKVLKLFRDMQGRDRFPDSMPLRYKNQMIATTFSKLTAPMPEDLDEQHDWTLVMNRGTRILIRYLWTDTTAGDRERTRELAQRIVEGKYRDCYVAEEGAFSLYKGAERADFDGTGEVLSYLTMVGCFSGQKQARLWDARPPEADMRVIPDDRKFTAEDLAWTADISALNSLRLYRGDPGPDYVDNVVCVAYPRPVTVLDSMELLPGLQRWNLANDQGMGNWIGQDSIASDLASLNTSEVPVLRQELPVEQADQILKSSGSLTVIGFDTLQTPIRRVEYTQHGRSGENGNM